MVPPPGGRRKRVHPSSSRSCLLCVLACTSASRASAAAGQYPPSSTRGYRGPGTGTFPAYCSKNGVTEASLSIAPLDSSELLFLPKLERVLVVTSTGARAPNSAASGDCWQGMGDGEDASPPWDCDVTNVVSVYAPQGTTGRGDVDENMLFAKVYDASGANDLAPGTGTCALGALLVDGYEQQTRLGEGLRAYYIGQAGEEGGREGGGGSNSSGSDVNDAAEGAGEAMRSAAAAEAAAAARYLMSEAELGAALRTGSSSSSTSSSDGGGGGVGEEALYVRTGDDRAMRAGVQALVKGLLPPADRAQYHVVLHTGDLSADGIRVNDKFCPTLKGVRKDVEHSVQWERMEKSARVESMRQKNAELGLKPSLDQDLRECFMSTVCNQDRPTPSGLDVKAVQETMWYTETHLRLLYSHDDAYFARLAMSGLAHELEMVLVGGVGESSEEEEGEEGNDGGGGGAAAAAGGTKLAVWSGDEFTLSPLLALLLGDGYSGAWPSYASLLLVEVYSRPPGVWLVRVLYNGEAVRLTGCQEEESDLCPVDVLLGLLRSSASLRGACLQADDGDREREEEEDEEEEPTSVEGPIGGDGSGEGSSTTVEEEMLPAQAVDYSSYISGAVTAKIVGAMLVLGWIAGLACGCRRLKREYKRQWEQRSFESYTAVGKEIKSAFSPSTSLGGGKGRRPSKFSIHGHKDDEEESEDESETEGVWEGGVTNGTGEKNDSASYGAGGNGSRSYQNMM